MKTAIIFLILLSLLILKLGHAEQSKTKCLEGIEALSGFGWGKLREKDNYNLYPLLVDFDFNLKPLLQNLNFSPQQLVQFQIEPYLAYASSPDSNFETGVSFFLKMGVLPQTSKFQPYVKAGTGMSYMTLHTREQATQFNFIDTVAIGLHYFFSKNAAFTLEGRYRHLSNMGIRHPNNGINTAFILGGVSYRF